MSTNLLSEIPACLNLKTILLARKVLSELIECEPEIKILDQSSNKSKVINEKIQQMIDKILEKYREDVERVYIPDIMGFFNCNCKKYGNVELPTGIYILMDKLKQYQSVCNIDVNLLFLQVFFHEYGHLFIHSHGINNRLSSLDKFNFEEPFCESISFLMTFEGILLPDELRKSFLESNHAFLINIKNLGIRHYFAMAELRGKKQLQNKAVYPYVLIDVEGDENIKDGHKQEFIHAPRIYPYKWFIDFATCYGIQSIDFFELLRILLNGVIKLYSTDSPCDEYKNCDIYFVNVSSTKRVPSSEYEKCSRDLDQYWDAYKQSFRTVTILSGFSIYLK